MEFLKVIKRQSFRHEASYVFLNLCLAFGLLAIIKTTGSIWLALVLVLLSKWRIFAVRPRFWLAHIQADLVSMIVSVGFVVFLYALELTNASDTNIIILDTIFTLLYIVWLLFLKSQSKRVYVVIQAELALLVGISAIFVMTYDWPVIFVVMLSWLVGYACTKHILASYDEEKHILLMSLAGGLAVAELCWLAYHWAIAYRVPIAAGLFLPQVSIVAMCLGTVAYKSYDSWYHHQRIRAEDVFLPIAFAVDVIGVLLLCFNNPMDTSINVLSMMIFLGVAFILEVIAYMYIRQSPYYKRQ